MLHSIGAGDDARRHLAEYQQLVGEQGGRLPQDPEVADKAGQLEQLLMLAGARP